MARKPLDADGHMKKTGGRNAANARERIRMRILSRAFGRLRMCLPWVPKDTKLSKLDTLRLATCYIRYLRHVVDQEPSEERPLIPTCTELIWPFGSRQFLATREEMRREFVSPEEKMEAIMEETNEFDDSI